MCICRREKRQGKGKGNVEREFGGSRVVQISNISRNSNRFLKFPNSLLADGAALYESRAGRDVVFASSSHSFPSWPTTVLDGVVALGLSLLAFGLIVIAGGQLTVEGTVERSAVESFFVVNSASFFVGWSWVVSAVRVESAGATRTASVWRGSPDA